MGIETIPERHWQRNKEVSLTSWRFYRFSDSSSL
nr:MAG TPA: hypothetical protein [Caudoviricetes sp.]